ncbi:hypothetical protein [Phenylobacterium sp.]|uniref:hypothetical protein n=1 Tax=Phenylobacterium sp. TaxID=1871053 RepID=UPI0035B0BAA7
MIRTVLMGAALSMAAGLAPAQAPLTQNPPTQTVICLDVGGQSLPAVCRAPSGRLDRREDICVCHAGARVDVPICPEGVRPPAETRAYEKARKAAARDGSLIGDLYEGRPMCVAGRLD